MLVELLADGRGAAHVGLDGRDVRRRRLGRLAEQRSITKAPRGTGDVVVPLAVTFRIAACVRKPPRGQPARQRHAADLRAAHARDAVMRPPASR